MANYLLIITGTLFSSPEQSPGRAIVLPLALAALALAKKFNV